MLEVGRAGREVGGVEDLRVLVAVVVVPVGGGEGAVETRVPVEGVKRSPRNGRMLFGLLESLKAQNKNEAANAVRREFDASWAKADVVLRVEDL